MFAARIAAAAWLLTAWLLTACGAGSKGAEPDAATAEDASRLFDDAALHTYELELSEEDLAFLDADPTAEVYVEGALVFEGVRYEPVGIRYKGSIGAFRNCVSGGLLQPSGAKTCTKLSMKVKFNWTDPDARFFGLKKLQLHSMNRDPSKMRERLAYKMFREMGVAAPRAVHARVLINGQYAGVFANVEQIDGRFTRDRFADEGGKGNVYKEVWPVDSDGQPQTEDEIRLGLRTNEDDSPPIDGMVGLGQGIAAAADDAQAAAVVEQWIDRDNLMRLVAVDRVIRADDGPFHFYCFGAQGCTNHNYYWYEELSGKRLWLIPWDMDGALFRDDGTIVPILADWMDREHSCDPFTAGQIRIPQRAPACDPLIRAWGQFADDYERHVDAFIEGPYATDAVIDDIRRWQAQIHDAMEEAAGLHADAPTIAEWEADIDDLLAITDELRPARGRFE